MRFTVKNILTQAKHVTNCSKYRSKLSTAVRKDTENFDQIYDKVKDKIVFSSYLENRTLKLGYVRNKILEEVTEKKEKKIKLENVKVKPFPSTLKFMDNLEDETKLVSSRKCEHSGVENDIKLEILKAANKRSKHPRNWLQDYEYFDEREVDSKQGTPDPTIPPSKIPCNGCGAHLHCVDSGILGYIPSEIYRGRTKKELKTIICQRCHFLKEYNIAVDVAVPPEHYTEILSSIKDKFALVILIVDLLDFPCSIWPEIQEVLGHRRPIFVVGNKVDLLPKDSRGYLDHIKKCLIKAVVEAGLNDIYIKHACLISAKTGFGVEELISQLHQKWHYKGDVYLVGCTNVGKSSLFNALLRSDYCKVEASNLIEKVTSCPWPGTTLNLLKFPILRPSDIRVYQRVERIMSEQAQRSAEKKLRKDQLKKTGKVEYATLVGHIGQTFYEYKENVDLFSMPTGSKPILSLNEESNELVNSKWCYDTPGVIQSDQIHNILTTEELIQVMPTQMIAPRVFKLKPGMSLFLAGLGRIDFISGNVEFIRLTTYSSPVLPILIVLTENADEVYHETLGSNFLKVPSGDEERLKRWPGLQSSEIIEIIGEYIDAATCDILLSSTGWIGIKIPPESVCKFKAWTPNARGIAVRKPALIPFGENLGGKKIRGSLAYRIGNPFILSNEYN